LYWVYKKQRVYLKIVDKFAKED